MIINVNFVAEIILPPIRESDYIILLTLKLATDTYSPKFH